MSFFDQLVHCKIHTPHSSHHRPISLSLSTSLTLPISLSLFLSFSPSHKHVPSPHWPVPLTHWHIRSPHWPLSVSLTRTYISVARTCKPRKSVDSRSQRPNSHLSKILRKCSLEAGRYIDTVQNAWLGDKANVALWSKQHKSLIYAQRISLNGAAKKKEAD